MGLKLSAAAVLLNIGCCWCLYRLSIDVCAGFGGRCHGLAFKEGDLWEGPGVYDTPEVEARA